MSRVEHAAQIPRFAIERNDDLTWAEWWAEVQFEAGKRDVDTPCEDANWRELYATGWEPLDALHRMVGF